LPSALPISLAAAAVTVAAVASIAAYATLSPQSQLLGPVLIAGQDSNEVALTYDDGPSDNATLALLDLFAQHQARATFFMIGDFVRCRPQIVRSVHSAGHLIGNHTQTHPWLTLLPARRIREELLGCTAALEDVIGERIRYVRFPHGARSPAALQVARELSLTPVQWNVMAHDWKPIGVEGIMARVDAGLKRADRRGAGANICMHDGHQSGPGVSRADTIAATSRLLTRFAGEGKRLVTVDAWG
jgi:peptidoglycan/xylan/chitin deacetylase (PgdA/CDA1 family)